MKAPEYTRRADAEGAFYRVASIHHQGENRVAMFRYKGDRWSGYTAEWALQGSGPWWVICLNCKTSTSAKREISKAVNRHPVKVSP